MVEALVIVQANRSAPIAPSLAQPLSTLCQRSPDANHRMGGSIPAFTLHRRIRGHTVQMVEQTGGRKLSSTPPSDPLISRPPADCQVKY
jgi:hypothetical protein